MKTCSISYVIRDTQITTTMRCYYTPIKMGKIEPGTTLAVSRKVIWNAVYTKITAMKKIGEELV